MENISGAQKQMFDRYVYDYLRKKHDPRIAELFRLETGLSSDVPQEFIDEPGSFLLDWWSLMHDQLNANMPLNLDADQSIQLPALPVQINPVRRTRSIVHPTIYVPPTTNVGRNRTIVGRTRTNLGLATIDCPTRTNLGLTSGTNVGSTRTNIGLTSETNVSSTRTNVGLTYGPSGTHVDPTRINVGLTTIGGPSRTNVDLTRTHVGPTIIDGPTRTNVGLTTIDGPVQTNVGPATIDGPSRTEDEPFWMNESELKKWMNEMSQPFRPLKMNKMPEPIKMINHKPFKKIGQSSKMNNQEEHLPTKEKKDEADDDDEETSTAMSNYKHDSPVKTLVMKKRDKNI